MALTESKLTILLTEHIFANISEQVRVTRSAQHSQAMGYKYTVQFVHEDVGGEVPSLVHVLGVSLLGRNSFVQISTKVEGTSIQGTFKLRFNGETTRPISNDAASTDMQNALNQLSSIAPSAVIVTRVANPIRIGPSNGDGGVSSQVGGYMWYITFASNIWKDPEIPRNLTDIPGNWFEPTTASILKHWTLDFQRLGEKMLAMYL